MGADAVQGHKAQRLFLGAVKRVLAADQEIRKREILPSREIIGELLDLHPFQNKQVTQVTELVSLLRCWCDVQPRNLHRQAQLGEKNCHRANRLLTVFQTADEFLMRLLQVNQS